MICMTPFLYIIKYLDRGCVNTVIIAQWFARYFVPVCFCYFVERSKPSKNLKGQCHEIFCFWFFSWVSFPPIPLGPFRIFSKIRGDIRKSRCTTVNDTGSKFLPPVSFVLSIPVANFPPVSTRPNNTQRCPNKIIKIFLIEDFSICHHVNDTGGAPWAANISVNFRKSLKSP